MTTGPFFKIVFSAASATLFLGLGLLFLDNRNPSFFHTAAAVNWPVTAKVDRREIPVRLKIPSIGVDAAIQYMGLTTNGEMEVPSNTVDVGWFDLGPRPGGVGSAVMAGHLDGEHNTAGVFINLHKLTRGDKLYIEDREGRLMTFEVRESRAYDPGYADDVFSSFDSGVHLNLITCDGVWNVSKRSYSKRLVVFADMVI